MGDERRPSRRDDYRAARIGAGAALTAVLCALLLIDAFSAEYALEPTTLLILVATIGGMFSVEVVEFLRGGKP